MKILSLHLGHNATAAIAVDGKIVGVFSQEKTDNIKNSAAFPKDAIKSLLIENNWKLEEIDQVVIAGNEVFPPKAYEYLYNSKNKIVETSKIIRFAKKIRGGLIGKIFPSLFEFLRKRRSAQLAKEGAKNLKKQIVELGLSHKPITHVEHHLCHARAAYHSFEPSNSKKSALIFTMDGSGDGLCATVTTVDENGKWKRIASTHAESSLGGIYSNTTRFLGMKILEHEYKVMGLAPYAKKKYALETYEKIFKPIIWLSKKKPLEFETKINTSKFYEYLSEKAIGERFDNIAAGLQILTEELVLEWIKAAIKLTGIKRIFTGGGVFMNVKLNRKIQELKQAEQVFFMPSCGDESNPIGACYRYADINNLETKPLENMYLGISYSSEDIKKYLSRNKIEERFKIDKIFNIEEKIAELIANREIVARFSGKCEWGARSLGNRAILAHPSHMESFYTINDYIKSRDFWMPFAPTILDKNAHSYLKNYNSSKIKAPYMITAFEATKLGVQHLRAALHQADHTLRPQVLEYNANPSYYRLIENFEKRTGIGAILNTSYNLHGFPLVSSLDQAIMTIENSELKFIAIGDFLLQKK